MTPSTDPHELDAAVSRLIAFQTDPASGSTSAARCRACGHRWSPPNLKWIRNHVESSHLHRGRGFPCSHCSMVSVSRQALKKHVYRVHKEQYFLGEGGSG